MNRKQELEGVARNEIKNQTSKNKTKQNKTKHKISEAIGIYYIYLDIFKVTTKTFNIPNRQYFVVVLPSPTMN